MFFPFCISCDELLTIEYISLYHMFYIFYYIDVIDVRENLFAANSLFWNVLWTLLKFLKEINIFNILLISCKNAFYFG